MTEEVSQRRVDKIVGITDPATVDPQEAALLALPRAVAEARITCQSYPWQAEGRLWDGPCFYFRVRSGRASLGFGATVDDAVGDSIDSGRQVIDTEHGGSHYVPWVPTDAEAWALFDVLLATQGESRG